MTGSLVDKHGKYYVVVRIPDGNGKMKSKWIPTGIPTAGNNKRKAIQARTEILAKLDQEQELAPGDMPFSRAVDKWMEIKATEARTNTLEGYRIYADKHIKPYFDEHNITLKGITAQNIQDYYAVKLNANQSANTLLKHHVIISGTLKEAVRKKQIRYNVANDVTLPKKKKFIGNACSAEQAQQLMNVIENDPLKPAVILGLYYGLRRSEVCGLRWRDIDFNAGTMQIKNTVVKMTTTIEHEATKSAASRRTMILIPATVPYLKELFSHYQQNPLNDPEGHVCTDKNGVPLKTDYISQHFTKLLKQNNLPPIRFHDLRHTAGSLLLESGLNMKQIQVYLGHEDISTTANIYLHLSTESKKESANVMGQLLQMG